jgi:phosphoglycolate phosphatase-like HAD superfamily hydrolase
MRCVLFDIDGTLLHSRGAGRAAMTEAFKAVYGDAGSLASAFPIAGKTDLQIVRGVGLETGVDAASLERLLPLYWDTYVERLERLLAERGAAPYPGVAALLGRLATHSGAAVGLLTGNMERGAWLKLRAAGLAGSFSWGAFGDAHAVRGELVPVALARARRETGHAFSASDLVVVGDTPDDIAAARAGGCRVLAVATGLHDSAALAAHRPDALFRDLTDADAVMAALLDGDAPAQAPAEG